MFDFLISPAFAQEAANAAAKGNAFTSLLPLILIMVVFYVFVMMPQNKKMKEHQKLIKSATKGDSVMTAGGIYGKIVKVEAEEGNVHVEIADGVVVKVRQDTIAEILNRTIVGSAENADVKSTKKK